MSNIYGGYTISGTPFIFDKIYNNKKEMAPQTDSVFALRYVLVKYCDTAFSKDEKISIENSGGLGLTGDAKIYWDNFNIDGKYSYDRIAFRKVWIKDTPIYEPIANLSGISTEGLEKLEDELRNLNIVNGQTENALQQIDTMEPNLAYGRGAVALGSHNSIANGISAIAAGAKVSAIGNYTFAQGIETQAHGIAAVALGQNTIASNQAAQAGGQYSRALSQASFAQGYKVIANQNYQTVVGISNDESIKNALFVVGNGDKDRNNPSNAFVVYQDGHATIQTQGMTNNSIACKEYVDSAIQTALSNLIGVYSAAEVPEGALVPEGAAEQIVILY